MNVGVIGTGYVGLVSGACFADFGHHVTCVDKDASKIALIKAGQMPIWEPGLEALVKANIERGRLNFTTELAEGIADAEAVRQQLTARLDGAEVLTKTEFRDRSLRQWLFRTGAGLALIGGALLGIMVGTVIVAQTLYSSTKDHLNEFATLRALGSSSGYIYKVILAQAGLSAVIGYVLGILISLGILYLSRNTPLPLVMTPGLAASLFGLTLFMSAISAISAIIKVTKIDPAMVFNR